MKDLDLREVGRILGLPLYIDVSQVRNVQVEKVPTLMTERDKKAILVRTILQRVFEVRKKPASGKPDPEELLPIIATAILTGQYDFTAKNAIRIFSLEPFKYDGELAQETRAIEVSWT